MLTRLPVSLTHPLTRAPCPPPVRSALELKYEALYTPLFDDRAAVVAGSKAVPPAEGVAPDGSPDTGIEGFWLKALQRSDFVRDTITEKDEEVLKYLKVRRGGARRSLPPRWNGAFGEG